MKRFVILIVFIAFAGCAKAEKAKNTKKTENRTVIIKGKKINAQYLRGDGKDTSELTKNEIKIIYKKFIPTLIQAFTKNDNDYFYNVLLAKFKHGFSVYEGGTTTLYRGKEAKDKFNEYLHNETKKFYYYDEFSNMFKHGAVSRIFVAKEDPPSYGFFWKLRVVFFTKTFQFTFYLVIDDDMPALTGFQCFRYYKSG